VKPFRGKRVEGRIEVGSQAAVGSDWLVPQWGRSMRRLAAVVLAGFVSPWRLSRRHTDSSG
jgi:hypothetical protein